MSNESMSNKRMLKLPKEMLWDVFKWNAKHTHRKESMVIRIRLSRDDPIKAEKHIEGEGHYPEGTDPIPLHIGDMEFVHGMPNAEYHESISRTKAFLKHESNSKEEFQELSKEDIEETREEINKEFKRQFMNKLKDKLVLDGDRYGFNGIIDIEWVEEDD